MSNITRLHVIEFPKGRKNRDDPLFQTACKRFANSIARGMTKEPARLREMMFDPAEIKLRSSSVTMLVRGNGHFVPLAYWHSTTPAAMRKALAQGKPTAFFDIAFVHVRYDVFAGSYLVSAADTVRILLLMPPADWVASDS